ncbi:MAG: heavy metal-responsive transcriptional regulator [Bdellovibrionales bacterium]|nr:heavy metal-responsive transcriptional regulator [Bdellovibrionales bacterium]
MGNNLMQIGAVAKKANVNIQTLRYYERRKILSPQIVKDSGYRLYSEEAVKTVLFIKHAQELGFSLEDIKELLGLRNSTPSRCQKVRSKATDKLKDVQEKLKMLKGIEKTLKKLIRDCEQNKTAEGCPIIENMEAK